MVHSSLIVQTIDDLSERTIFEPAVINHQILKEFVVGRTSPLNTLALTRIQSVVLQSQTLVLNMIQNVDSRLFEFVTHFIELNLSFFLKSVIFKEVTFMKLFSDLLEVNFIYYTASLVRYTHDCLSLFQKRRKQINVVCFVKLCQSLAYFSRYLT